MHFHRTITACLIVLAGAGLSQAWAQGATGARAVDRAEQTATLIPVRMAKPVPLPRGKTMVMPAAKLMRVDDGVFELEFGKSIDLTDRKILLSINYRGRRKECCTIRLNGRRMTYSGPGSRIDLKKERHTSSFVEDKSVCFLDLIDVALPRGTNGLATFRLHCI